MKKSVLVLSILVGGLMLVNPSQEITFAQNKNKINSEKSLVVQGNDKLNNEQSLVVQDNGKLNNNQNLVVQDDNKMKNKQDLIVQDNDKLSNKQNFVVQNNDKINNEQNKVNNEQNLVVQDNDKINNEQVIAQKNKLNQNEAQQLLKDYNNKVNYIFIGNASDFEALDEKGLEGYVFLPDADSDMGYFVDQNTHHIYYFHPSGYFELIK